MNYQKLSEKELKALYNVLAGHFGSNKHEDVKEHVAKYYPKEAVVAIMTVDSEYNDETYDNTCRYLAVYDENDNEILPLKETAAECREEWSGFDLGEGTDECQSEIVVHVGNKPLPAIYIKQ